MTQACRIAAILAVLAAAPAPGCRGRVPPAVTVYVSLDEPYARPVLDSFTRASGVAVRAIYDTEATKSRGLARRIVEERARPRADVFWSSEVLQMAGLKAAGVLVPYRPPTAENIPDRYRDPDGCWTGFAGRFRVLAYYAPKVPKPPRSLLELTHPRWRGEVVMADPQFGTTTTEAAALFQVLGPERARAYYRARKANATRIVDGNSVAAEQAARGDALIAQTDTDDVYSRIDAGRPLGILFPDQQGMGALLIPNTAGLIRGGPRPAEGRRFLDHLLSEETELLLAGLPSRQLPLHPGLAARAPAAVRPLAKVRTMRVDYARLYSDHREIDAFLREVFAQ